MFTLDDILRGTEGRLDAAGGAFVLAGLGFDNVVIDSRKAKGGALFVALPGERTDGHNFVLDAAGHGAHGALVRDDWVPPSTLPPDMAIVRVDDPGAALQRLAASWRSKFTVQTIGITGSIGKTTTKEVIAGILSTRFDVLKSERNLNNEIGLPLTLLQLTGKHEKLVLEMGAGFALGELTRLCEIARPEIAVVTYVLPVHLERMGTIENIALNKSELVRALPRNGTAVLNRDDPRVFAMREVSPARVLTFGLDAEADLYATDIDSQGLQGVHFTLHSREAGRNWHVKLPLVGSHSVQTALAAAGAARAAGMTWDDIVRALSGLNVQVRLLVVEGYNGATIIDDTYNAAPESTIAALNLLEEMQGRKIAVLGDMLELGTYEVEGHRKVGRRASAVADYLIVLGNLGRLVGTEALESGMAPDRIFFAADKAQVVDYLRNLMRRGDYVLVKGSRGLQMEEIVDGVKA